MQVKAESASEKTYDTVSIAFHWATVALILALFLLALFPGVIKGSIALHKTLGASVFLLVLLRIVWRLFLGARPGTTAAEPLLLRLMATGAHLGLYALLLVAPVLGFLYLDAKGVHFHPFGLELPNVFYYDRLLAMQIYSVKQWVVYGLLSLIAMHAAAAIGYHAYIRKDGVLRAMLPRRFRRPAIGA